MGLTLSRISDWLELHDLNVWTAREIVAAQQSGLFCGDPFPQRAVTDGEAVILEFARTRPACVASLVEPVLKDAFGEVVDCADLLRGIEFADLVDEHDMPPHTIDRGIEAPPLVKMAWRGRAEDVICLAHEIAHAVQIILSKHESMPPVARETCAFLFELLLIEHTRLHVPGLHGSLCEVWRSENDAYIGRDLDALSAALADPRTPYHYRQNYPIARLAAVEMFQCGKGVRLSEFFASGRGGMRYLPIDHMANRAGNLNHLPPVPELDAGHPVTGAYRSLGAMVLLDIDYWRGEAEKRIEEYYSGILAHLRERTVFLALNEDRKPIGYATWIKSVGANAVTMTRQVAPFGDHLALQRALERHIDQEAGVFVRHDRSARRERAAW